MANLAIKDLPNPVHTELKKAAREQGQSLNAHVISLLEASVAERRRRQRMRDGRDTFRSFVASLPPLGDSTELIREDRDRGH